MKRTILCVEDDQVFAGIVAKTLEAAGFSAVACGNGEEGLRRAKADRPDAILLDIGLPRKDGFELLEDLKKDPETWSIPVFMLSRLSSREDIDRCFTLGCEDYLIKAQQNPEDAARRLQKHFGVQSGFARWEVLVGLGILFVAASLLYWQLSHPKIPSPVPSGGVQLEAE